MRREHGAVEQVAHHDDRDDGQHGGLGSRGRPLVGPDLDDAPPRAVGAAQQLREDLEPAAREAAGSVKESAAEAASHLKEQGTDTAQDLKAESQDAARQVKDTAKDA